MLNEREEKEGKKHTHTPANNNDKNDDRKTR